VVDVELGLGGQEEVAFEWASILRFEKRMYFEGLVVVVDEDAQDECARNDEGE
jgi:hypothetical protein